MNTNPFSWARAMFAAIAAAMALASPLQQKDALSALDPYESRGKNKTRRHVAGGTKSVQRASAKARNVRRNRRAHR